MAGMSNFESGLVEFLVVMDRRSLLFYGEEWIDLRDAYLVFVRSN